MVQLQSQEQSEAEIPNTSIPVGNSCTDSYGPSGHMLKVRKPYTISKQREKWTEDEHQKFLEALKLYGRGWHKIQEHVGTKTAVQIRSHAQKFFSKIQPNQFTKQVVRGSSGSTDNSIEPIEIPPPRPKRKPVHPYPRKPVDILEGMPVSNQFERSPSPKGIPASKQVERSPSPDLLVAEKESQSPTSVLSEVASEAVVSALSEQQNGCSSPSSCTTDMNSSLLPTKKENEHTTSSSSSDGDKESLSSVHAPSMSIKLFGTTISVACCQKPPSPGVGPFLSSMLGGRLRSEECIERSPDKELGEELSLGLASANSTLLASGSSAYRYLELQCDNGNLLETNTMLPWRVFCEGISYNQASARMPMDSSVEEQSEEKSLVERSCTGSQAGSAVEAESGGRMLDVGDSKSHQPSAVGRNSLQACGREGRDRLRKITRGFVPYKRCMAVRNMSSPVVVSEECERQRARVCS